MVYRKMHITWIVGLGAILLSIFLHITPTQLTFHIPEPPSDKTTITSPIQAPLAIEQQEIVIAPCPSSEQQISWSLQTQFLYALRQLSRDCIIRQQLQQDVCTNFPSEHIAAIFTAFW